MTATILPVVGQQVVLDTKSGPKLVAITKVTPSGLIEVEGLPGSKFHKHKYSMSGEWEGDLKVTRHNYVVWYFGDDAGQLMAKHTELKENHDKRQQQIEERNAARRREDEERQAKHAAELGNLKDMLAGSYAQLVRHQEIMENGDRLLWLNMPVKPEFVEYKGGVETVFIRLHSYSEKDWETRELKTMVEMYASAVNNRSGGFGGRSGRGYTSDEAAVWEALHCVYFAW